VDARGPCPVPGVRFAARKACLCPTDTCGCQGAFPVSTVCAAATGVSSSEWFVWPPGGVLDSEGF